MPKMVNFRVDPELLEAFKEAASTHGFDGYTDWLKALMKASLTQDANSNESIVLAAISQADLGHRVAAIEAWIASQSAKHSLYTDANTAPSTMPIETSISQEEVEALEGKVQALEAELALAQSAILPGGETYEKVIAEMDGWIQSNCQKWVKDNPSSDVTSFVGELRRQLESRRAKLNSA